MRDADCVEFLRWALPSLGLRWAGFRRPRRQVCRRIERRYRELGLPDLRAYRDRLAVDPAEWDRLESLCRVTISRFFRDREVMRVLERQVLPELARLPGAAGRGEVAVWSAGCGAGEEPYSLAIIGRLAPSLRGVRLRILGTDTDAHQLGRARRAVYRASSLRDVPPAWLEAAFEAVGDDSWRLRRTYRRGIELALGDLRREAPAGPFHLVLCRNLAFTYMAERPQREVLGRIRQRLVPGGALVLGAHERLPGSSAGFAAWRRAVWRRAD